MKIRDLFSRFVPGGAAPPSTDLVPVRGRAGTAFMRGGRGVTFAGWRPALREARNDVDEAWELATARSVDAIQNSGWLAGMVDQAIANTVGTGLRLKAMPENSTFGMSNAEARKWARTVESRFELWSRNATECDVEGRRTFAQMQAAAFGSWLATGEIFAELPWRKRPWGQYGTKVRLLSPARLVRASSSISRLFNGVYQDADGMPIGYRVNRIDAMAGYVEYDVRARDRFGRQRVVHVFNGQPETSRGITPLVPALQVTRQFDQLSDATLTQSIVASLFAATITSDEPTEEVLAGLLTPQEQARMQAQGISAVEAYMEMVAGFYDHTTLDVGINGRLAHLFPGNELKFHRPEHPGADYRNFALHLLREVARCLGLTYESATGDYTGATYSSVRMATGEVFAITKLRRANVVVPFCQPAYEAWLEEEIQTGRVGFPGGYEAFVSYRDAASRAEWRGSPKPQADDLKIAKAHEIWRRLGVMSDEMIANDLGVDIEDVYAARAAEKELREEYGLPEPDMTAPAGGATADAETATDEGA